METSGSKQQNSIFLSCKSLENGFKEKVNPKYMTTDF